MAVTEIKNGPSNRDLILESALNEFSERGFAGARMSTIAERAGVNSRMLYHYFSNKEGLYRAALAQILETGQGLIAHFPVIRMTIDRETITELFSQFFNLLFSQPRTARLLVAECFDGGKRLAVLKKERPDLFEPILEKAVALFRAFTGSLRKPDDKDPFWVIGIAGLVSFLATSYDTVNLFLGKDMTSPKKWEKAIESLLFGVFAAEKQPEGIVTQAG